MIVDVFCIPKILQAYYLAGVCGIWYYVLKLGFLGCINGLGSGAMVEPIEFRGRVRESCKF